MRHRPTVLTELVPRYLESLIARNPVSVATYYTEYWSANGFQPLGSTPAPLAELFQTYLPAGGSCLDVGCGDGGTSGVWLRDHHFQYTGVDVSPTAIELARGRGLNARVIDDATTLPFADAEFDATVCIEVLEHLFDPFAAVREMLRIVKPGGVLLVTTPNVAYWRRRFDLAVFGRWNPYGDELAVEQPWRDPHIRFFTTRSLHDMLQRAGCERITVGGQAGAGLQHLPLIGHRLSCGASRFYRFWERRCPSLFGLRLHAIAYRPHCDR